MITIFSIIPMMFLLCIMWLTDGGNILIRKYIFGQAIVYVYNGEYSWNTSFTTFVPSILKEELGKETITAVRYPVTNIGKVTLNPDGTAEYCGEYRWKRA